MIDQELRGRQQHQHAGAGRRIDHRHRGRQRGPNQRPSRIEFGTLPIKAMPMPTQSPRLSWNCQSCRAEPAIRKAAPSRSEAERIDGAGSGVVEQAADQRRRQSARERGQRIDRDDLGAVPAEALGNRLQEDGEAFAEAAADHRQHKAQRQHVQRDACRQHGRCERVLLRRVLVHGGIRERVSASPRKRQKRIRLCRLEQDVALLAERELDDALRRQVRRPSASSSRR